MALGCVEIQALVQVDPNPEPGFVYAEETSQPRTEEADHRRICIGEHDLAVACRAFTGVQSSACSKESLFGQSTHPVDAFTIERFDLP